MMVLVIGGSGSGKSAYAEELACGLWEDGKRTESVLPDGCVNPGGSKEEYVEDEGNIRDVSLGDSENLCGLAEKHTGKYYIAAMQVSDGEGRRRVRRHRAERSGKGFYTIEQPVRIEKALSGMREGRRTVLLECVSNLTGNEMFAGAQPRSGADAAEDIIRGIERIKEHTTHLIVVSNNVFEDGILYESATMDYIRAMGRINCELAALADRVVEVVAGIPVPVKDHEINA